MSQLDQIISVAISKNVQAPNQPGFGVPLILGQHTRFLNSDLFRTYTSLAGMIADGFITSDAEYLAASAMMSQNITVSKFLVGKRTAPVVQVSTVAVNTLTSGHSYVLTVNNIAYTYVAGGADTQQAVLAALLALLPTTAFTGAVTGTGAGALLTLTSATAGLAFSLSGDALLTCATTTANHGASDDIAAIQALGGGDNWYALVLTSKTDADILNAAKYIETQKKIYVCASSTAGIATSSTTDVLSVLKGLAYNRTMLIYHTLAATQHPDAAWVGEELVKTPGSSTWKFKQLIGVTPDVFSSSVRSIIIGAPGTSGKNGNIYETVSGVNITEEGMAVSGQFLDIQVGVDWIAANMQAQIFAVLSSANKVPYTDQGIAMVEAEMRSVIQKGIVNGLVANSPAPVFTIPTALSQSVADRANRNLPNMNFSCRLAGALHFVTISGTVTV